MGGRGQVVMMSFVLASSLTPFSRIVSGVTWRHLIQG
jgi:hypothetical protein